MDPAAKLRMSARLWLVPALWLALVVAFVGSGFARASAADPQEEDQKKPHQERRTAYVTVRVVDEAGQGVAGATVTYALPGRAENDAARQRPTRADPTGADGVVELRLLPRAKVVITASQVTLRSSRATTEITTPAANGAVEVEIMIRIRPDVRIAGRVLDDATGSPIAHATLRGATNDTLPSVEADALGRFTVQSRSWSAATYAVTAPGYGTVGFVAQDAQGGAGEGAASPPVEVRLLRPNTVVLHLHNAVGEVLVDALLPWVEGERERGYERPAAVNAWRGYPFRAVVERLDDDGDVFAIRGIPAHSVVELAVRDGGVQVHREVLARVDAAGTEHRHDVDLARCGALEGVVELATGGRCPGRTLHLWVERRVGDGRSTGGFVATRYRVAETVAGSEGEFRFDGLTSGTYTVELDPSDLDHLARPEQVEVVARKGAANVTLICYRDLALAGRVVDVDGQPVHARVTAYLADGGATRTVDSDPNTGRFRVQPLRPERYSLFAQRLRRRGGELQPDAAGQRLRIRAGEPAVELVLGPTGALRVALEDRAGEEAVGRVILIAHGSMMRSELTRGAGDRLRSNHVPVGEYTIFAVGEGTISAAEVVQIVAGSSLRKTMKLLPAARLEVDPEERKRPLSVLVTSTEGHRVQRWLHGPELCVITVPAGSLVLELRDATGATMREELSVAAGSTIRR